MSPTTAPTVPSPFPARFGTPFLDSSAIEAPQGTPEEYQPGVCNIGPEETALRRRAGHAGAVATLALAGLLLATRAPRATRLLVALPAAGAASGYFQAQHRFCAAYGARGVSSLGKPGDVSAVEDPAARAADKATARRIGRASGLIGLAAAAAMFAAPPWRR